MLVIKENGEGRNLMCIHTEKGWGNKPSELTISAKT